MIIIENLNFSFKNKSVFNNLSLVIPESEISIFIGANGVGKSTLLRLLIGNLQPDSGEIQYESLGRTIDRKDYGVLYSQLRFYPSLTVKENIQLKKIELGGQPILDQEEFLEILNEMNLIEYLDTKASNLSKGNQMKLSLALVLIQNPAFLFFDEPTSNLDLQTTRDLTKILNNQNKSRKTTILTASHDQNFIEGLLGKTIELKR